MSERDAARYRAAAHWLFVCHEEAAPTDLVVMPTGAPGPSR